MVGLEFHHLASTEEEGAMLVSAAISKGELRSTSSSTDTIRLAEPVSDSPASEEEDQPTSLLSSVSTLPAGFTAGDLPRFESLAAPFAEFLLCLHDKWSPIAANWREVQIAIADFLLDCW